MRVHPQRVHHGLSYAHCSPRDFAVERAIIGQLCSRRWSLTYSDQLVHHTIDATQSSLLQALAVKLLEMNTPEFVEHSKAFVSDAGTLAEIAKKHKLASGGIANHLVLRNLRPHGLTKSNAEKVCEACLNDDAGISYDFVVGSQANSRSFYSEATLLKLRSINLRWALRPHCEGRVRSHICESFRDSTCCLRKVILPLDASSMAVDTTISFVVIAAMILTNSSE